MLALWGHMQKSFPTEEDILQLGFLRYSGRKRPSLQECPIDFLGVPGWSPICWFSMEFPVDFRCLPLFSKVVTLGSPFLLLYLSLDYPTTLGNKYRTFSDLWWIKVSVSKQQFFLAFLHAHLGKSLADIGYRFLTQNSSSDIIKFFVEFEQETYTTFSFRNLFVPQSIFGTVPLMLFKHGELLPVPCQCVMRSPCCKSWNLLSIANNSDEMSTLE